MSPMGVLRVLIVVPLVMVWLLAVADVVLRVDLRWWTKLLLAGAMLAVFPLTLLYLLARPASQAGVAAGEARDWRYALMEGLDGEAVVEAGPPTPLGEVLERLTGALEAQVPHRG